MANRWKLDDSALELLNAVDKIAVDVVRPAAAETDSQAQFPSETVGALRRAGLLGLIGGKEVGGRGQGLRAAVAVAERIARECSSSAMVTIMHYCSVAVIERFGLQELRRSLADGGKLATLAFSEAGSRSHFLGKPVQHGGKATKRPGQVERDETADHVGRARRYLRLVESARDG